MQINTKAIVLHFIKYGESQVIVDLFTEQVGRVSFICPIPKSSKGRAKRQFFQPLTILDVQFDYRQKMKLQRFKDIRIAEPFSTIPFDPYKLSISLFCAEFLYYATRDEQKNALLYDYVEKSILWLDSAVRAFSNFHLVFMLRLSRFLGFFPNLEDYHPGDLFDLRSGCFVGTVPLHKDFLLPADSAQILLLIRLQYETMHLLKISREDRNRCTALILQFYRLHIPDFPELKSFDILRELFA